MKGKVYCVGVGPGDPGLMTLKAVSLIRENGVIAVPGREAKKSVAYSIAAAAVPEMEAKELVPIAAPMVRDREKLAEAHRKGAEQIEKYLDEGRDVVYLTLGDPTVYCTFSYIQNILESDGYETVLVPGVPSFCAAAARLGIPLAEWDEEIHVVPAAHRSCAVPDLPGTLVLMKSGSGMAGVKEELNRSGREVRAVENCGMETERIYTSAEEIPDDAGYFSLVIARERHQEA